MKQTIKKSLCLLLSLLMLLGTVACGAGDAVAADLSEDTIRADAQEYLATFVGADVTITSLSHTEDSVSDTEMLITCSVGYTSAGTESVGVFAMTYVMESGAWTLNGMNAQLDGEAPAPAPETPAPAPTPEMPAPAPSTPISPEPNVPASNVSVPSVEGSKIIAGYSLQQTGTFADTDALNWDMEITVDENRHSIIFSNGQVSEPYYDSEELGNGYYAVTNSAENINSTGLVTMTGEVLIPCEAAYMEWIDSRANAGQSTRFLKVVYSTGITTNEDEAYFYVTDKTFSLSASDGDILHKGYAKIYDVVNKQFVGTLQSSFTGYDAIEECGDCVVLKDAFDSLSLYDCNGNLIKQISGLPDVGNGYLICYDSGSYDVYDTAGTLKYSSGGDLSVLDSTSGYLKKYVDGGYVLIDLDGNQILPSAYQSISDECYGVVEVKNAGEYQLITLDGTVLASTTEDFYLMAEGYYYFTDYINKNSKTLVGPDGVIVEGAETIYDLAVANGKNLMVLNQKSYNIQLDTTNYTTVSDGIITAKSDATGKTGLFELFNGQQLLGYEYHEIEVVNGNYLFARKGDTWTIFELIPQYR